MKTLLLLISFFISLNVCAQGVNPGDWGLKQFHMEDEQLGDIYFYVTEEGIDEEKPLLFMVIGCGGLPTMVVAQ